MSSTKISITQKKTNSFHFVSCRRFFVIPRAASTMLRQSGPAFRILLETHTAAGAPFGFLVKQRGQRLAHWQRLCPLAFSFQQLTSAANAYFRTTASISSMRSSIRWANVI